MPNDLSEPALQILLVATDFDDPSVPALVAAREHALRAPACEIHVVHVLDASTRPAQTTHVTVANDGLRRDREIEEARAHLATICGEAFCGVARAVVGHVRVGAAWREVVALARALDADAIIVGTHGRRGVARIVEGSVAERIVRTAPCSVIVARARETYDEPALGST